jgi:hypothetical protein
METRDFSCDNYASKPRNTRIRDLSLPAQYHNKSALHQLRHDQP